MGAVDVTAVLADIAAQAVPIGLIGVAVLLLLAAIKAFHWVRSALGDEEYDPNGFDQDTW